MAAADMALEEYERKRNFGKTIEPPPGKVRASDRRGARPRRHGSKRLCNRYGAWRRRSKGQRGRLRYACRGVSVRPEPERLLISNVVLDYRLKDTMRTENNVGHDQTHKKESSMKPIRTIHFERPRMFRTVPSSTPLPIRAAGSRGPIRQERFVDASKSTAGLGSGRTRSTTTPTFIPTRTRCSESRRVKRRYGLVETVAHS
jgi:hypothetical protein